ncbi:MAG: FKBP-type peptidyl-prolyl cis-trans isomerase [Mycobacteriales bacterium]
MPRPPVSLALAVLALAALATGCASHGGAATVTSSVSASTSAGASAGASVGASVGASAGAAGGGLGSVTGPLGQEPHIVVPTGAPPTTLVSRDLVIGTGATATLADSVTVQYLGVNYATGTPFDSSWSRGQPAVFSLQQVVPGFAQGIAGMRVGGRREIVIPPALGYGAQSAPPAIVPNETLIFVVDLLAVSGSG